MVRIAKRDVAKMRKLAVLSGIAVIFVILISLSSPSDIGGKNWVTDDYKEEFVDQAPVASASHSYHFFPLVHVFSEWSNFQAITTSCTVISNLDNVEFRAHQPINGTGTLRYNNNLVSGGNKIYRANISGEWSTNIETAGRGMALQICIDQDYENEANWGSIHVGYIRTSGAKTYFSYITPDMGTPLNYLYVRFYVYFGTENSTINAKFYSLNVQVYGIDVTEGINGVIQGDQNKAFSLYLQSCGVIDTTASNIRLYFSNYTQVNDTCPFVTFSGTYPDYTVIIPHTWYNGTGTVSYRLRLMDGTFAYWTPINSFDYDDLTDPTVDSLLITNPPAVYNESVKLEVLVSDVGESYLNNVQVSYRQKHLPSEWHSLGVQNIRYGSTSNSSYWTIPGEHVSAREGQGLEVRVIVSDRRGRSKTRNFSIDVSDLTAPVLSYRDSGIPENHRVQYNTESLSLVVNVNEPALASGFGENGTVQVRYKINGTPDNDNDYSHVVVYPGSLQYVYSDDLTINMMSELGTNIKMNDTVYYWFRANDTRGNVASQWNNASNNYFIVADDLAPEINSASANSAPAGYDTDKTFRYTIRELEANGIQPGGVNTDSILFEYQVNVEFDGGESAIAYTVGSEIDEYLFTIAKSNYVLGDVIYYRISAADMWGNSRQIASSMIPVNDIYAPIMAFNAAKSNASIARTLYDLKLTISGEDYPGGLGVVSNSSIRYRFGANLTYSTLFPKLDVTQVEGNDHIFIIPENVLTLGRTTSGSEDFYYVVRIWDQAGNYKDVYGLIKIFLQEVPTISGYLFKGFTGETFNTNSVQFQLDITKSSIMYYTINGTRVNDNMFVGKRLETTLNFETQGWYEFVVYYHNQPNTKLSKMLYVDWTAPGKVSNVYATYENGIVVVQWNAPELDYEGENVTYIVYRGNTPDFIISDGNIVGKTSALTLNDEKPQSGKWYYKVMVVDLANNESPISDAAEVTVPLSPLIWIGIIAAVGIVGVIAIRGIKNYRNRGKTLAERKEISKDVRQMEIESSKKRIEGEDEVIEGWGDGWGADAVSPKAEPKIEGIECSSNWDHDMIEYYNTAMELYEMESHNDAISSLQLVLKKATEKGDNATVAFINDKIKQIYGS